MKDKNKYQTFCLRLPKGVRDRFKSVLALQGLSMNEVIGDFVLRYLREKRELQ